MITQVQCVRSFVGDAFGHGEMTRFKEGGAYALPSGFIAQHADKFIKVETKPLRRPLEIKGHDSTGKRTHQPQRA